MFRGHFAMNDFCPLCDLLFEREEGYFLGAMYVSYGLSSALLIPLFFVATALLPGWNSVLIALLLEVLYLPFIPAVFRYSRVLWAYFDRFFWPEETVPSPYERFRRQQLAKRQALSQPQERADDTD
jgi:hypothetical protein